MPGISDLPDELLLQIVSYLQPPPPTLSSKPYAYWPAYISKHHESTLQQDKDTTSLAQTNNRFYDLLYPTIHSSIHLQAASSPGKLYDNITLHSRLGLSITTAHITSISPEHTTFIFFLPNIRTIYLSDWSDWESFNQEDSSLNGDSPITSLYLLNCGAFEAPLTQLLRWPKALKELWYEASQGEWEGHFEGQEAIGFSCSAISRALKPLQGSLERLVFTRTDPGHEGLFYSDGIDLRGFEKLREVRTFHALLVGYDAEADIWRNLPGGLERLEVWYDDAGYMNFLIGEARPEWLFGVLQRKREYFPKLGKVRIVSMEWWEYEESGDDDGEDGGEGTEILRNLPTVLKQAFKDAKVSYSIHLHENRWFKEVVEGGSEFEEDWDEKRIVSPYA